MAYDAGQALLQVVPSMRGVQTKIDAEASKWGVSAGKSFADGFSKSAPQGTKDVPIGPSKPSSQKQGSDSGGAFADGFRRRVEAALKALPDVKINADTSEADTRVAGLKARLEAIRDLRIGVDISAEEATAEVAAVQAELARLGSESPNIQVKADTGKASAELAAIQAEVDRLDGRNANVDVNVDDHGSIARAESGMSGLLVAGIALAPALIPVGAALVGTLSGIATVAGAGAAGLGVLMLGFSGISEAVKAVDKAHVAAGADATKSAQAQAAAAQQVQSAEASLANARAAADSAAVRSAEEVKNAKLALSDAERQANQQAITSAEQVQRAEQSLSVTVESVAAARTQAARQVADAESALTQANLQAADAQRALNDARERAARDLEDSANRQADAQLGAQQAALDLQSAQANLDKVMSSSTSTDLQKQQAALSLAQAQQRLVEAQQEAKRATEDNAKAQKAGINGDSNVVSAQKAIADALKNQKDARQRLTDALAAQKKQQVDGDRQIAQAHQALADAERQADQQRITSAHQVARAQQQVADAQRNQREQARQSAYSIQQAQAGVKAALDAQAKAAESTSTAARTAATSLAGLSPAGRKFVTFITGTLEPTLKRLKGAAQAGLLPGVEAGLKAMQPLLPSLVQFVGGLARTMGHLATEAGKALTSPFWRSFFGYIERTAGPTIKTMAHVIGNLATGFAGLLQAFAPVSKALGAGVLRLSQHFADLGKHTGKGSPVQSFIAYVQEIGPKVAETFGALARAAGHILVALAPLGGVVLKSLKVLADVISRIPIPVLGAVGSAIAVIVVGVKAWSIAQAALNAVMDANPIGLVVIAIAALAAGFVYAYKHSETFRNIVKGAMDGVRAAAQAVADWFTQRFVPFFTTTIPNAFQSVLSWVKTHWVLLLSLLVGPFPLVVKAIIDHWDQIKGAFRSAKDWVFGVFATAWHDVVRIVSMPVNAARDAIGTAWDKIRAAFSAAKDWVTGIFQREWAGLKEILTNPAQAARNVFENLFGKGGVLRTLFSGAVDALGSIWDGIRDLFAKPINWVIENVINKLIGAVNKVSNALGQGDLLKPFGLIDLGGGKKKSAPGGSNAQQKNTRIAAASGAVLPGWTPGVDVHHFYSPTAGYLDLSGGESIMRPEFTAAMGGEDGIRRLNMMARLGKLRRGFKSGGVVWPLPGGTWSTYPGHDGIDLNAPNDYGKPFLAAVDGTISYVGWNRGYGDAIFEVTPYGTVVYGHSSKPLVRAGEHVTAGEPIGLVGSTGHSSGPHLHFGFPGGTPQQALALLQGAAQVAAGSGSGILGALNPAHIVDGVLGDIRNLIDKVPGGKFGLNMAQGVLGTVGHMVKSWAGDQAKALLSLPGKAIGSIVGAVSGNGNGSSPSGAQAIAQALLSNYGWSGSQMGPLVNLWNQESGWRYDATNPSSGAYGIPQSLPASKMAAAGSDWRTNPATQIRWGLGYIKDRYGSPAGAWAHELAYNWYRDGGVFKGGKPNVYDSGGFLSPGLQMVYNGTGSPEPVLTRDQWKAVMASMSANGDLIAEFRAMRRAYEAQPRQMVRLTRQGA